MAKMATRSLPGKSLDMDSVPQSQNLLMNPSSELCKFTDPEIEGLFTCFPPETIFRPFDSSMKSDVVSPTWVCFTSLPFLLGYNYLFTDLTQRFFTLTGISNSQAMLMLWRVLHTIEQIISNKGIDFNLFELSYLYSHVTHGSHRFLFKAKPHQPLPILKTTQMIPHGRINSSLCEGILFLKGIVCPKKWILKGRI
ncbi:hypothetical protein HanRHA438_Chr09g0394271 [Helianthus annuus]|uniref:Uncharacterized protein n=1 Tax=Helianthus annuus TaxID=4232 RepID=A0A9K3I589_HELAN|nr:hypothetical protein HanXRQr2_Chr09g0382651 [Helianthus annuus]KAJ0525614.1 hypothetical protein HanHA300_Chr09g0314031 [Helianthus annuus]KAJ0541997.1 hypothetical protein HanHA89_Chr09g0334901 [Helianthus annuus]KAJ0707063.1 hypothetical protein HanLR1_Chr09g0314261 [Helianthus annuus]KAJ0711085.1 hypothetical protein HanOQP8_Chr09g0319851 [Helianthus annuus]